MDLFVYCAGVLRPGDGVTSDAAADREMMDVNATGAVHLLGLAADHCRLARRGHLAAIGSIAGDRGRKGNPAYGASKAALHTYLEGLRNRLHPYGVRVTTVKPGYVRTRMLARREGAAAGWPAGSITAEDAARRIARGLDRGREVFYVPAWWGLVAFALRHTPRFVFKRLGPP
jgi:short-subunit dehydrogenase